jgi:hypothetical protein
LNECPILVGERPLEYEYQLATEVFALNLNGAFVQLKPVGLNSCKNCPFNILNISAA